MLINEVMSRACNKHIKSDEKSELTIIQAWDESSQPNKPTLSSLNDDQPLDCDEGDNIFSICSSDDERQPQHNHINKDNNEFDGVVGNVRSDNEDDGQLSGYETNDNDYSVASDEENDAIR
ncbi:hypothetical protein WN943_029793 [Citrus x changshan-huyou]